MQRDWKEAERFFRESMELARRGFGESDPHFAATLVNLAEFLRLQRRYQEAEPLYREVCLYHHPMGRRVWMHVCLRKATQSSADITKQSGIGHVIHCSCLSACCHVCCQQIRQRVPVLHAVPLAGCCSCCSDSKQDACLFCRLMLCWCRQRPV